MCAIVGVSGGFGGGSHPAPNASNIAPRGCSIVDFMRGWQVSLVASFRLPVSNTDEICVHTNCPVAPTSRPRRGEPVSVASGSL